MDFYLIEKIIPLNLWDCILVKFDLLSPQMKNRICTPVGIPATVISNFIRGYGTFAVMVYF